MPLVVPGLTSNSGSNDQTSKWMNELVGKKIGDSSNETVRSPDPLLPSCNHFGLHRIGTNNAKQTFAKTDLPKEHRVLKEGDMSTMDHKPDRYAPIT